jgi:diaminopimelate epimerase
MTTWFKAHGLGNDYLVAHDVPGPLTADEVRAVCDRHRGCGGDGVLEPVSSPDGLAVRIWNPDGSIAEKSGNGLRIFAWWARRFRGAPAAFPVWVVPASGPAARVTCEVNGDHVDVELGAGRLVGARRYVLSGVAREAWAVSVGNPHCVVFVDEDPDALPWREWGALLERHPDFPARTNVQVARVEAGGLAVRIWERGAGETSASGSSACAVAWAAVHTGRLPLGRVEVRMPGGSLTVTVRADGTLRLAGPVAPVGFFLPSPAATS